MSAVDGTRQKGTYFGVGGGFLPLQRLRRHNAVQLRFHRLK
jgi:hypothetical protein